MTTQYIPVAGLTIKQALTRAIEMSTKKQEHVLTIMNDIVMVVDKNTNVELALQEYHDKLDFKYQIQQMKKTNEQNMKKITFTPSYICSFETAVLKVKKMAEDRGTPVFMDYGGVFMYITPDTNIKQAVTEYKQRLALKFAVLSHKGTKYDKAR